MGRNGSFLQLLCPGYPHQLDGYLCKILCRVCLLHVSVTTHEVHVVRSEKVGLRQPGVVVVVLGQVAVRAGACLRPSNGVSEVCVEALTRHTVGGRRR